MTIRLGKVGKKHMIYNFFREATILLKKNKSSSNDSADDVDLYCIFPAGFHSIQPGDIGVYPLGDIGVYPSYEPEFIGDTRTQIP